MAVTTFTTASTIGEMPSDEITLESVVAAAELIRKRLGQLADAALLGLEIKRCDWMEPDECIMLGDDRIVHVKGGKMLTLPVTKLELRPEMHIEPQGRSLEKYSRYYLA